MIGQVALGRMRFVQAGALHRTQRIEMAQSGRKMRSCLPMGTCARGLLRGPRSVFVQCLHILCVRGVMHES